MKSLTTLIINNFELLKKFDDSFVFKFGILEKTLLLYVFYMQKYAGLYVYQHVLQIIEFFISFRKSYVLSKDYKYYCLSKLWNQDKHVLWQVLTIEILRQKISIFILLCKFRQNERETIDFLIYQSLIKLQNDTQKILGL